MYHQSLSYRKDVLLVCGDSVIQFVEECAIAGFRVNGLSRGGRGVGEGAINRM